MSRKIIILFASFLSIPAWAGVIDGEKIWGRGSYGNLQVYSRIIPQVVDDGYYYSALPLIKEVLSEGGQAALTPEMDNALDDIILNVGVRQFELLPARLLDKSKSPSAQYILAKKYFRAGDYRRALEHIVNVPDKHPLGPFSLILHASALSIEERHDEAISIFKRCMNEAKSSARSTKDDVLERELLVIHDHCLVGIPRAQFAQRKYESSNNLYLDLPKSSYVWPEILFEEAWNDFYLKNFNRTLGKLVTYNSPFLEHVFSPEVHTLEALSYLELCLFDDAKKSVDSFYQTYQGPNERVANFIQSNSRDYAYYYKLARRAEKSVIEEDLLLNRFVKSIVNGETYNELMQSLQRGRSEYARLKSMRRSNFNVFLMKNTLDGLRVQKELIGSYVRRRLVMHNLDMNKTFEHMSYIKLEVLSRTKGALYRPGPEEGILRGDVRYLKRNEKQYFWSFNGEFWADELGDYVFALSSQCKEGT